LNVPEPDVPLFLAHGVLNFYLVLVREETAMIPIFNAEASSRSELELVTLAGAGNLEGTRFSLRTPVHFNDSFDEEYDDFEDEDDIGDEDEDFDDDDDEFDDEFDDDFDDDDDDDFDDDEDDFGYDDDIEYDDLDE